MVIKDTEINNEDINLGKIIRVILMQSKLIIILSVIFFSLIALNYYFSERIYKIETLLKVDGRSSALNSTNMQQLATGTGSYSNLDNLVRMYETRSSVLKAINDLKLNINEGLDSIPISNIRTLSYARTDQEIDSFKFLINIKEKNYDLLNESGVTIRNNLEYSKQYEIEELQIDILPVGLEYGMYEVSYRDPKKLISTIQRQLTVSHNNLVSYISSNDGLMTITYLTSNISEGRKILQRLNEIFIQDDLSYEVQKAKNAISFIDGRIETIEKDLLVKKNLLREFQQRNASLNLDLEVQTILASITEIQKQLDDIQVQKAEFKELYTRENPIYQTLLEQEMILIKQKDEIEKKIQELPYSQQNYLDLYRESETTQNIYDELIAQRLNFSIVEASTIGNIRVIDQPYLNNKVSPSIGSHLFLFVLTFFLSVAIGLVRGLYFTAFTNPAEIREGSIETAVLGVLTDFSEKLKYKNSLESFYLNLESLEKEKKNNLIIGITSPLASCGKTLTSINFSKFLADLGKRVLLLDFDLKKGNLHKQFNLENRPNLKEFLSLDVNNLDGYAISKNFYCIPKIKGLSDTFGAVSKIEFQQKIEELSTKFNYVIFDTAPILSVADTGILLSICDLKFGICRHNQTKLTELKQMLSITSQIGEEIDGIIYNHYKKPQGYYGYYGLYGNYDYQYYAEKYLYDYYEYKKDE